MGIVAIDVIKAMAVAFDPRAIIDRHLLTFEQIN